MEKKSCSDLLAAAVKRSLTIYMLSLPSPPHLTKNLLLSEKRKQKYGGVRFFAYLTQPIILISEKVSQLQKGAIFSIQTIPKRLFDQM